MAFTTESAISQVLMYLEVYFQTSNISCTLVGNKIVHNSDVVGALPVCWHCSNYIFILHLTPGFNGLGKGNLKAKRETFKFGDSVHLNQSFDGTF